MLAVGVAIGFEAGVQRSVYRAERCIDAWWYDGDGIVEAPWWTEEEASASVASQKWHLERCIP